MARKTVTLLSSTERTLEKAGANIKKARLRRNIRAELLAEQAGISVDTLFINRERCIYSFGWCVRGSVAFAWNGERP